MKQLIITIVSANVLLAGCLASPEEYDVHTSHALATEFAPIASDEQCYIVADVDNRNGEDVLFIVDKTDPEATRNLHEVGEMGADDIEAIAFEPATQTLYAADGNQLGTIDLESGSFTPLAAEFGEGNGADGTVEFTDVDGLAFDPITNLLYGSVRRGDGNDNNPADLLIVIDPETGEHRSDAFGDNVDYVVITPVSDNMDIDDLAIDVDGVMYAIANTGGKQDRLVTVDKRTGKATDIGRSVSNDVEGLAFDTEGNLWGSAGKKKTLYQFNKESGEASVAVPVELDDFTDFEALDCMTRIPVTICDIDPSQSECQTVCESNPDSANCLDDTYSVTGGGCSAAGGSSGSGWFLLFPMIVLGVARRRR